MTGHGAGAALIWCPFPDEPSARAALASLLDDRLIACGNLLPGMRSLFAWQGNREESSECGALLKTSAALMSDAMRALAEVHPYDAPAIAAWTVHVDAGTLAWLEAETRPS